MLTNKEAYDLMVFLESEEGKSLELSISGFMKLKKNLKVLSTFVKELGEAEQKYRSPSEELAQAEKLKNESLKPFVVCDAEGNIMQDAQGQIMPLEGREPAIRGVILKFNNEHSELIESYNKQVAEWFDFFNNKEALIDLEFLNKAEIELPKKGKQQLFEGLMLLAPSLFEEDLEGK